MGIALGYQAYAAIGMQTAFGTPVVPTITYAHMRNGSPISPQSSVQIRQTTAAVMPKASQVWYTVDLVPFSYEFELNTNATAWLTLLTAAFGRRVQTVGAPDTDVFTVYNNPVDGGTDGTPATNFYNHGLTIRETLTGTTGGCYEIRDGCVTKLVMTFTRNDTIKMAIEGTGQNMQDNAGVVSYTDISGSTYNWAHVISNVAVGGIQVDTANPPTAATGLMIVKSAAFTLENNLVFEAQLGGASGNDLRLPTRNDFPTLGVSFDCWFSDTEAQDAVTIMTDFITNASKNVALRARFDANNLIEFLASAATRPMFYDTPRINVSGPGPVGFQVEGRIFPEAITTDATLKWTSP